MLLFPKHISQMLLIGEGCEKLPRTSLLFFCKKDLNFTPSVRIQPLIKDWCTISLSYWEFCIKQVHVISVVFI